MGNLKTFVLTCLGVGLAVGAGFYLFRKFTSANEDDRNIENTATQVTAKINRKWNKFESQFGTGEYLNAVATTSAANKA